MSDTKTSRRTSMSTFQAAAAIERTYKLRESRNYIHADQFLQKVADVTQDFDTRTFRKLIRTAIVYGYTSNQDLIAVCGDVLPRRKRELEKDWNIPSPAICDKILKYLSTLNPGDADAAAKFSANEGSTGDNKLPWRHSRYAPPAEEPTPQG